MKSMKNLAKQGTRIITSRTELVHEILQHLSFTPSSNPTLLFQDKVREIVRNRKLKYSDSASKECGVEARKREKRKKKLLLVSQSNSHTNWPIKILTKVAPPSRRDAVR